MLVHKLGKKVVIPAVLLSTLLVWPVQGANFVWLDNSPMRFFTDADLGLMEQKSEEVLNDGRDGEVYHWSNPETGNSGNFMAEPAADRDGQRCRWLTIVNQARTTSNTSRFDFCRQASGEWLIVR